MSIFSIHPDWVEVDPWDDDRPVAPGGRAAFSRHFLAVIAPVQLRLGVGGPDAPAIPTAAVAWLDDAAAGPVLTAPPARLADDAYFDYWARVLEMVRAGEGVRA